VQLLKDFPIEAQALNGLKGDSLFCLFAAHHALPVQMSCLAFQVGCDYIHRRIGCQEKNARIKRIF
jgi:hypothetical protein